MILSITTLVNLIAVLNRSLSPFEELKKDFLEITYYHLPDLTSFRAIGAAVEVLIPPEKRVISYKLAPRPESGRLLATLGNSTYLVYIPYRRVITKTSFITFTYQNKGIGVKDWP